MRVRGVLVAMALAACDRPQAGATASQTQAPAPTAAPIAAPAAANPSGQRAQARSAYLRDRDAVRKAKPKTEAEITKVIGRPPDSVIDVQQASPPSTMLQWFYEDKEDGRDVLQVTVQADKITLMNL